MSNYIVRIELHGNGRDYAQLHTWMKSKGFRTTIKANDGTFHQLPTATYEIDSSFTLSDLRDWIQTNLPPCGSAPLPWILVIKSDGAAWSRLPHVAKAA